MTGQSIAHYHITSKLGQGGMRAVYRATDTKLDCEVAIKVVGELLAARPDFARVGRTEMGKWFSPELLDQIVDGLRKAGLEMELPSKP